MSVLQQNYAEVCRRIAEAEQKAGRQAGEVCLIAVSKTFPSDDIREVYAAGQRDFGENYIQEWYEKTETLADLPDIVWHVIGDVQKQDQICRRTRALGAYDRSSENRPPLERTASVRNAAFAGVHRSQYRGRGGETRRCAR